MDIDDFNAEMKRLGKNFQLPGQTEVEGIAQMVAKAEVHARNEPVIGRWGTTWLAQSLENLKTVLSIPTVGHLKGLFKGEPGIVVSPGPSLRNNWERLKGGVRVGGTRSMLYTHITMLVDAGAEVPFYPDLVPQCELFCGGASVRPEFFSYNWKRSVSFAGNGDLDGWIYGGALDTGGSVANTCASLLRWFECDPIVLVGQDCGYGDMFYADGTTMDNGQWRRDGVLVAEKQKEVEVKGYYGGMVKSTPTLSMYREWFENRSGEMKRAGHEVKLWNCTEGGAYIDGWEHRDLEPFPEIDVGGRIQEALSGVKLDDWRGAVKERVRANLEGLDDVWRLAAECKASIKAKKIEKLEKLEGELQTAIQKCYLVNLPHQDQVWRLHDQQEAAQTEAESLKITYRLCELIQRSVVFLRGPLKRAL